MKEKLKKLFVSEKSITKVGFSSCIDCDKCIWLYFQLGTDIDWQELIKLISKDRNIKTPIIDVIPDQQLVINTCTVQNMQLNINELSKSITKITEDSNNLKGRNIGAYKIINNDDLLFLTQLGNNIFIHLIENGQWKSKNELVSEVNTNEFTRRAERTIKDTN